MPGTSPCELYLSGHNVSVVQWKNSVNNPRTQVQAEVISIDVEAMAITLADDRRTFTCRTHDAATVNNAVERRGSRVIVDRRWSLLLSPKAAGTRACVSADYSSREWVPCRRASNRGTDAGSLLERLVRDGGFLVPVTALEDALEEEPS